jgi:methionyl-tRNA formyltransferase
MDVDVDSGPLLSQRWFDISEDISATELYQLVAENLRDAFCELYMALCKGTVKEVPQDSSKATFRAKRTPSDGHIDFRHCVADVSRLIKAVTRPYPGAYTYHGGRKVHIWKASSKHILPHIGVPGQILFRQNERLLVQCNDGPVWVEDFTVDDVAVSAKAFPLGSKFGYSVEDEIHRLSIEIENLKKRLTK